MCVYVCVCVCVVCVYLCGVCVCVCVSVCVVCVVCMGVWCVCVCGVCVWCVCVCVCVGGVCVCVVCVWCVCSPLRSSIAHLGSHSHLQGQDTEQLRPHTNPFCSPLITLPASCLTPSPEFLTTTNLSPVSIIAHFQECYSVKQGSPEKQNCECYCLQINFTLSPLVTIN